MARAAVLLLLALASVAAAAEPVLLGPCGPIGRRYDALEVPGADLHLGGPALGRLGVVAFAGGQPHPIPFQVDEKRGRKLAMPGGREAVADDKPGVLDADDVVVFMACDAGERATAAAVGTAFPAATAWREIQLEDPTAHATGWAYLIVAEQPPVTDRRYVAYDPQLDLVTTAAYRVGLVNALPSYLALSLHRPLGPNLLDGIRLRADATFAADLAHWTLNEQQGQHELVAWKAGPVRVVRRSRHHVVIGLGIKLSAGTAHTYFYPQHVFGPGSLKLPFSPSLFFRNITAFGGADGRLRGWRYHAPGTPPEGFRIDGHMDDAERKFQSDGKWFVVANDTEGLLFVARTSENLAKAVPLRLVYRDDAATPYPPENDPGTVPLVGYEGRNVERLPGGRYTFSIGIYALDGFHRGAEQPVLAALDAPVVATVSAVSARAADGDARAAAR